MKKVMFGSIVGFLVGFLSCYFLFDLDDGIEERAAQRKTRKAARTHRRLNYATPPGSYAPRRSR